VFIGEALNPASIEKVGIDEQKKSALVVVADSQLSLAIGKNGQNVRLAAKLTGWKIDIISSTEYEKEKMERDQEIKAALAEETASIVDESAVGEEVGEQSDEVTTEESKQETPEESVPEDSPSS
jgi:N utilization substance protein A